MTKSILIFGNDQHVPHVQIAELVHDKHQVLGFFGGKDMNVKTDEKIQANIEMLPNVVIVYAEHLSDELTSSILFAINSRLSAETTLLLVIPVNQVSRAMRLIAGRSIIFIAQQSEKDTERLHEQIAAAVIYTPYQDIEFQ